MSSGDPQEQLMKERALTRPQPSYPSAGLTLSPPR